MQACAHYSAKNTNSDTSPQTHEAFCAAAHTYRIDIRKCSVRMGLAANSGCSEQPGTMRAYGKDKGYHG